MNTGRTILSILRKRIRAKGEKVMTYLELLNRVAQGTQPIFIEYKCNTNENLYFKWNGRNYENIVEVEGNVTSKYWDYQLLSQCIYRESDMVENDCIKAFRYENDGNVGN